MRVLLDTHTFLWAVTGNPRLKPATRGVIKLLVYSTLVFGHPNSV